MAGDGSKRGILHETSQVRQVPEPLGGQLPAKFGLGFLAEGHRGLTGDGFRAQDDRPSLSGRSPQCPSHHGGFSLLGAATPPQPWTVLLAENSD